MTLTARTLVWVIALAACNIAFAQRSTILKPKPLPRDVTPRVQVQQCGGFTGIFGPFDFRTADPEDRNVVETYHLQREMAIFLSGRVEGTHRAGTGPIAGGFVYVVRAIPNHPVGMMLLEQLARKLKSEQPQNIEWPIECMYVRAFMLVPDDPVVRAMYGIYLAYRDRREEAIYNLDMADLPLRASGAIQYQMGLANLSLGRNEQAQLNAMAAARMNFPGTGLREQLQKQKKWRDDLVLPPLPDINAEASSAAASAADAASAPAEPATQ
jgi:hypothetical protein